MKRSESTYIDTCSLRPTGTLITPAIAKPNSVRDKIAAIIVHGLDRSSL